MAKWTDEERNYLRNHYGRKSARVIGEHLGRSTSAVAMQAAFLGITKKYVGKKTTLCVMCQNAVPNTFTGKGCSWSRHLEPVEGWTAKPTLLRAHNRAAPEIGSYQVLACPEYIPDKEKPKTRRLHRVKGGKT